jgi:hypothetical protein
LRRERAERAERQQRNDDAAKHGAHYGFLHSKFAASSVLPCPL